MKGPVAAVSTSGVLVLLTSDPVRATQQPVVADYCWPSNNGCYAPGSVYIQVDCNSDGYYDHLCYVVDPGTDGGLNVSKVGLRNMMLTDPNNPGYCLPHTDGATASATWENSHTGSNAANGNGMGFRKSDTIAEDSPFMGCAALTTQIPWTADDPNPLTDVAGGFGSSMTSCVEMTEAEVRPNHNHNGTGTRVYRCGAPLQQAAQEEETETETPTAPGGAAGGDSSATRGGLGALAGVLLAAVAAAAL